MVKQSENQTFDQMNRVALQWLSGRDPRQLAKNAGVDYDGESQTFSLSSLGVDMVVHYPDYRATPPIGGWHSLLLLHYLHLADGAPLTGQEMSFSQMRSGMVRGGGIYRKFETAIRTMENFRPEEIARRCEALGGVRIRSNGDLAYRIPVFPRFPVTLKIWLPDAEFPASGRLLLDSSADHYLTIEDGVTVAEILIDHIAVPAEKRSFAIP